MSCARPQVHVQNVILLDVAPVLNIFEVPGSRHHVTEPFSHFPHTKTMLAVYDISAVSATLQLAISQVGEVVTRAVDHCPETRAVLCLQPPSRRPKVSRDLEARIQGLRTVADACQSATSEFARILVRVERALHDCELALAPVSALPGEILTSIFHFAIASPSVTSTERSISTSSIVLLSQVCSRWRGVANACSALWTDFTVNQRMPTHIYQKHLQRSGDRAIHLTVNDNVPLMPFSVVSTRLDSLKELTWNSPTAPYETLFEQFPDIYSRLRSFNWSPRPCSLCQDLSCRHITQSIRSADFTKLESLVLRKIAINSRRIRAPSLVSLHLEYTGGKMAALNSFFSGLQALQKLTVVGILVSDSDTFGEAAMSFILPSLQILSVMDLELDEARLLVRPSHYPRLCRFEYYESRPYTHDGQRDALPALLMEFLRGCTVLEEIETECYDRSVAGILSGLNPDWDPPRRSPHPSTPHHTPILRTIDINIARDEIGKDEHLVDDSLLLADLEDVLQNRARAGYDPLETLIVSQCEPDNILIESLEKLVGTLGVRRCR